MTTRFTRRRLSLGLLVLAAGCAADSSRATRNGASNELLIVGYDREPDTMNRYATHILEDIQSCVIEGLVTADEKMNIEEMKNGWYKAIKAAKAWGDL